MRIAILGSVALPVPPPAQGGTEWIAYYQAVGLADRGYQVLLFAAKGTKKNFRNKKNIQVVEVGGGDVVSGSLREKNFNGFTESSRKLRLETVYLSEALQALIEHKDSYDVILNNIRGEAVFLPVAKSLDKPFASVMHLNLFPELAKTFQKFNTHIITISNAQRKDFPGLNYLATVYNCVDIEKFTFNPVPQDYVLMVGSIGRHKNQGEAIAVAKELGLKLVLAGKINDQDYFDELKKDIDGEKIKWFGEVGFTEKVNLYQNAKAFIFPINWEEPFGLVMIEAMSCGTPVVAFNRGAVSEVVRDGLTGYVVDPPDQQVQSSKFKVQSEGKWIIKKKGIDGLMEAVRRVGEIDRMACRKHIEENFTVSKMIDGYEKALRKLMSEL